MSSSLCCRMFLVLVICCLDIPGREETYGVRNGTVGSPPCMVWLVDNKEFKSMEGTVR